ncbi:MAG: hypothetical protein ACHQD8_07040 [Chitinophagales bacterium]
MKLIIRFIDFFLYTSLFTACCATGLCMATERLITGVVSPLVSSLHILVFGSTILVYNMPRIAGKPHGRLRTMKYRKWHFVLFFIGSILTVTALCLMPLQMIISGSVLGVLSLAYFLPILPFKNKKRLRDFGWLKITVLAGVWTIATSVLPILYWQKNIDHYPFEILVRLLFIFTLCVIFDIRDMQTDQKNNINTLPQKVGIKNSYRLINSTLTLFVVLSIIQYFRFHEMERLVSALLTAVITRVVITYLQKRPSDRAYLVLADGVMLLYAVLVLIL